MSGTAYRVETASTARAGCRATHCKKEGIKIPKGDLRQGTLVTIQEHTSFQWRHWGCVTPEVLHNWATNCEGDMDLVDGYDDLPADLQAKVKRALEQKHVDDEDWNGDVEMNRYDPSTKKRGMFVKTPKKTQKDDDGDSEASPSKKKATKKRARTDAEDEAEPAPKKAKGRKKAAKDEDDAEPEEAPKKAVKKGKKAKDEDEGAVPEEALKKAAKKGRKAKDSVVKESEEAPAPKATKGKKAKAAEPVPDSDTIVEDEPAPPKKTKAKKAAPAATDGGDIAAKVSSEAPKKRKGRPKKAATED